jgi:hypothetical protein
MKSATSRTKNLVRDGGAGDGVYRSDSHGVAPFSLSDDLGVKHRTFSSIKHAVITHDADFSVADAAGDRGRGGCRTFVVAPASQQNWIPRSEDRIENIPGH